MNIWYQNFCLSLEVQPELMAYSPPSAPEPGEFALSDPFEFVFEGTDYIIEWMTKVKYGKLTVPFKEEAALKSFVKEFRQHFDRDIEAAGGIVIRPEKPDFPLMILKNGVWDLPKGKIDAHEIPETAAKREIKEETGLSELEYAAELPPTYHFYYRDRELFFKTTHWFIFHPSDEPETLIPQTEEGITDACWKELIFDYDVDTLYTYENIREVLRAFRKISTKVFAGDGY